jgi:hypothetical protein
MTVSRRLTLRSLRWSSAGKSRTCGPRMFFPGVWRWKGDREQLEPGDLHRGRDDAPTTRSVAPLAGTAAASAILLGVNLRAPWAGPLGRGAGLGSFLPAA